MGFNSAFKGLKGQTWPIKLGPIRSPETSVTINLRCVTSQKNEDLIYTAFPGWNNARRRLFTATSSTKTIQVAMLMVKTNQIRKVTPVSTLALPLVRVQSATVLHDPTVGIFHVHRRHLVQSTVFRLFPVLRDVTNIRSWGVSPLVFWTHDRSATLSQDLIHRNTLHWTGHMFKMLPIEKLHNFLRSIPHIISSLHWTALTSQPFTRSRVRHDVPVCSP